MADRISQVSTSVSGTAATQQRRVSQVSTSVSGTAATQQRRISQISMSVSQLYVPGLVQAATFLDPDTFPAGGSISQSADLVQAATFVDGDTFPAGGSISHTLTQTSTYLNPDQFPPGAFITVPMSHPSSPRDGRGLLGPAVVVEPNRAYRELEDVAQEARRVVSSWVEAGPGFGIAGLSGWGHGLGDLGPNELPGYGRFKNNAPEPLSRIFAKRGRVTTPAIVAGDVTVVNFRVPDGYWCRIQQMVCVYTGTGFVDGSGDLEWRLMIGSRYARNMGRILFELGTPACGFPVSDYIGVPSNWRVRMIVRTVNLSGNIQVGTSLILCALQGWMVPNGKEIEGGIERFKRFRP